MGFTGVDALDDLFDGLVFDEQIANFDGVQNLAHQVRGGDLDAVEANAMSDVVELLNFAAVAGKSHEASRLSAIFQREFNVLGPQQLFFELRQLAVVENFSAVDDHDAAAKLLDVVEVVGGEQNRGVKFAINGAQKMADLILGDYVETDGRLVEKKQRRIVQQRGCKIAAHPLAERQLPHRRIEISLIPKMLLKSSIRASKSDCDTS